MARQKGLIQFTGKLGNTIGYTINNKYFLRSATDVQQTPASIRAAKDFGTASKAGKLIRHALDKYLLHIKESSTTNRLTKSLTAIIHGDSDHPPGERMITNLQALKDFQFNSNNRITKDTPATAIALSINFTQATTTLKEAATIPALAAQLDITHPTLILLYTKDYALDIVDVINP
jgi:hypothetical protein